MGILQSCGNLAGVPHRRVERKIGAMRMVLPKGAAWSIVHHQHGYAVLHSELKHANNMGMIEAGKRLGFGEELRDICIFERSLEQFEGCLSFQVDVLAEVDLCKAASSQ